MTDTPVTPPAQNLGGTDPATQQGGNPAGQDPVSVDAPVIQKGVFGGSAEAVDNLVNNNSTSSEVASSVEADVPSAPVVPEPQSSGLDFEAKVPEIKESSENNNEDSGETFNFDEISFDNTGNEEGKMKNEELIVNSEEGMNNDNQFEGSIVKENDFQIHDQDVDVKKNEASQNIEIDQHPESVVSSEVVDVPKEEKKSVVERKVEAKVQTDNDESVEKDENNDQDIDVIHDAFDDLYEGLETLYDMKKLEEGNTLFLGDYAFVIDNFSEDIIKIKKGEIEVSLILETGSFELFINNQLLFAEEDLVKNVSKFEEVKNKLNMFLDLAKKELDLEKKKKEELDAEIAAKVAERQKHLEIFKAF